MLIAGSIILITPAHDNEFVAVKRHSVNYYVFPRLSVTMCYHKLLVWQVLKPAINDFDNK